MAVQETRWQGEAIINLKTQTLLQTGKNTGRREYGVAGIADNICNENKMGHGSHSSKIVVLFYVLFVCKCVLPPDDNPIAVNKYIISTFWASNRSVRGYVPYE